MRKPFLGTVDSFRKAYPEVKTLRLTIEQKGDLRSESQSDLYYTEDNVQQVIPCGNPRCQQGGYDLMAILITMIHNKDTIWEGEMRCNGHEGSPKGRRKGDPCMNSIKYKMELSYVGS